MTPPPPAFRIESPCINVCVLDAAQVCTGCGRHIDDIARWGRMTPQERHHANMRAQTYRTRAAGSN